MMNEIEPNKLLISQLSNSLDLVDDNTIPPEIAIHEMRRCFKKARSYLRLYRYIIDEELFLDLDKRIGTIARSFTKFRESQVNLSTFNHYITKYKPGLNKDSVRLLSDFLQQYKNQTYSEDKLFKAIENSKKLILETTKYLNSQDFPTLNKKIVLSQIQKVFKDAKLKYKEARKTLDTEIVHDWRKCLKILLFEVSYIYDLELHYNRTIIDLLTEVAYLLGKDHDQAIMLEFLKEQKCFKQLKDHEEFVSFFEKKIKEKRLKAIGLGEAAFSLKSSRFIELINNFESVLD